MKILNIKQGSLREIFWVLTVLGIIFFPCFVLKYCSSLMGNIYL